MKPVPLAEGRTQPVTVISFPPLTETFDFVVVSCDCAASPTAQIAARQTDALMSFMDYPPPFLMPRSYPSISAVRPCPRRYPDCCLVEPDCSSFMEATPM